MLELAQDAINSVRGDRLVEQAARTGLADPLQVVAIGKAACAMMEGAHRVLGDRIERSLLITKQGYVSAALAQRSDIEIMEAGHPVPSAASLAAGQRLLEWLAEAPRQAHLLFLISGGTSSLVEVPQPGISLAQIQDMNRWLLGSGLDIERINGIRQRISRIKGGGLLHYTGARRCSVWLLSDVQGDKPAMIGSGLLYPATPAEAGGGEWPPALEKLIGKPPPLRQTGADDEDRVVPEHRILGNLQMACEAARAAARRSGYPARLHEPELDGDAEETGHRLASQLRELAPGVHIWGGETTVRLPANPGRGGRNQHLALAAALELAGRPDVCLLALGTDGSDGPGEDAGALVDGGTIERGTLGGLNAADALRRADSGSFLEASGDLIATGETGTNVRDLVIAIKS